VANDWLNNQPAETIRNQAAAVVAATTPDNYRDNINTLVQRADLAVHFIAGEHSAEGWDVSAALKEHASSYTLITNSGHLMMLDNPVGFATVLEELIIP
jgi:pimeloyl-ACP methyl ester carboxylesterase